MKRPLTHSLLVLLFSFLSYQSLQSQAGQCVGGGCTFDGTQYPSTTQSTTSSTFVTVATNIYAGEWQQYDVVSGAVYEWSLCSADGGNCTYDGQLTLYNSSNVILCYSDDLCGDDPKIRWTATYTGQVKTRVNQYNCVTNSINTTLVWRRESAPPSTGATCANPAIISTFPFSGSNTTCGAVNDYGTQCGSSYGGGEDFVYQLNITATGTYDINLTATGGGSWIGWFLKSGSNCTNVTSCLANATSGSGVNANGSYNFTSTGTYYLIIDTWPAPNCSAFNLSISPQSVPGATCANPVIISTFPFSGSNTTCDAVNDYGIQCGSSYGGGEDFVYQLNITATGTYDINLTATGGGSYIGWFLKSGSNCTNTSSCLANATSSSGVNANGSYNFTSTGTYYLIIDTWPAPNCSAFNLSVSRQSVPGATCANPIVISALPYNASATTCGAVNDYGIQCGGNYGGGEDLVYQFNISSTGNYNINLTATNGGSYIGWFLKSGSNCTNAASCLANATSSSGVSANGSYNFTSTGTYFLIIDTWPSPNCSDFNISISPAAPANDQPANATTLTVGASCSGSPYTNANATADAGEPSPNTAGGGVWSGSPTNNSVWFKFTAPGSGTVSIATVGGTLSDSRLALYATSNVNNYGSFTLLGSDDDGGVSLASAIPYSGLTPGVTYYLQVDGYNGASGTFCLSVNESLTGLPGETSCTAYASSTGTGSATMITTGISGNQWFTFTSGNEPRQLLAAINPNGQNLGDVTIRAQRYGSVPQAGNGAYLMQRYFDFSSSSPPSGGTPIQVRLFYTNAELTALNSANGSNYTFEDLMINHYDGVNEDCSESNNNYNTGLSQLLTPNGGIIGGSNIFYLEFQVFTFSELAAHFESTALPVELLSFSGRILDSHNQLQWTTASEKNVQWHIIERSADGQKAWSEVGRKEGQLNASDKTEYVWEDLRPAAKTFYRLRSVDYDGQEQYSHVITLVRPSSGFEIVALYPNPAAAAFAIDLNAPEEGEVTLLINDLTGRGMLRQSFNVSKGINTLPVDIADWQPGLYSIQAILNDKTSISSRFVKQ